jgi:hypothetical protein
MRKLIALCGLGLLLAGCQVPGSTEEAMTEEATPAAEVTVPAAEAPVATEVPAAQ